MIESISVIISIFNGLKNGLNGSSEILKKGEKKKIIGRLVILKINLEDIIDTSEDIFTSIEKIKHSRKTSKKDLKILEDKIRNQSRNLHNLLFNFRDPTIEKILKTFNPQLRRDIKDYTHIKKSRINYFMFDLSNFNVNEIRNKYDEEYLRKGYNLLDELKETSANFTSYIKENASIEDII